MKPILRRALVLTDGATGQPQLEFIDRLREQDLHIYVVLPAESAWEDDLRAIAAFMTILPPLWG
jgi:hypothetical protein